MKKEKNTKSSAQWARPLIRMSAVIGVKDYEGIFTHLK